jgi:hypothetical protein
MRYYLDVAAAKPPEIPAVASFSIVGPAEVVVALIAKNVGSGAGDEASVVVDV